MDVIDDRHKISVDTIAIGTVLVLIVFLVTREKAMMYQIEPESVVCGDSSLTIDLKRGKGEEWVIAFIITRKSPSRPLNAASFELKVIDIAGQPLPDVGDWEESLVEVGGSMSTTVNGRFRFLDIGSRLSNVSVKWEEKFFSFRLIS